LAEIILIWH